MKIGILTFHNTLNYGSFLQTLGLYHIIQQMGYECVIIDYECRAIEEVEIPNFKLEALSLRKIAKYFLVTFKMKKKYNNFQRDLHKYMQLSDRYTRNNIQHANDEVDIFLVGSDILWDLNLTKNDLTYFLDFVENSQKKYSFSTSIGRMWNDDEKRLLKDLLSDFQKISIREETSAKWLREFIPNHHIDSVCDPTMLCELSYWEKLADNGYTIKGRYIFVYFSSEKILQDAIEYSKINHCRIICVGFKLYSSNIKYLIPESIADFLSLIRNADAVFSGSYHGVLFSLYFKKQVYVYLRKNEGHNIRLLDLIHKLNIEKECMYSPDNLNKINYNKVTKAIEKWRDESLKILYKYWN